MTGWLRVLAGVAALLILEHGAHAQLPDPLEHGQTTEGSETKIPVTMPGSAEVLDAEKAATSTPAPVIALEQPVDPEQYVCGPGDTFDLNFWGPQNFRLRISVDLEGRAFISKVGFVSVAGKTLSAVRTLIKTKVRSNYPGLQFELTLANTRSFLVHVIENVKQPGIYSARPLERVSVVLARAGGITGSKRRIDVRHRNGTHSTADLVLYELTGDTSLNPYLLDGDVVVVPFAELSATIDGAVRRPGTYELIKTKDLAELVDLSGGFASTVARALPTRIVRYNEKQQETTQSVSIAAGTPVVALADGDKVTVPGADEVQRSVLVIGAVVGAETIDLSSTGKRVPFIEGDTVSSLLTRAGGIRSIGDLKHSYIARPQSTGFPQVVPVDLEALIVRRDRSADVRLAMGDTIVIPPLRYSVLVEGAVARAGLYTYDPALGVPEYVAHAGGLTRTAKSMDSARIIDSEGKTLEYHVGAKLHPGDAILVPERSWSRPEIVQLVIGGASLLLSAVAVTYAVTR